MFRGICKSWDFMFFLFSKLWLLISFFSVLLVLEAVTLSNLQFGHFWRQKCPEKGTGSNPSTFHFLDFDVFFFVAIANEKTITSGKRFLRETIPMNQNPSIRKHSKSTMHKSDKSNKFKVTDCMRTGFCTRIWDVYAIFRRIKQLKSATNIKIILD